MKTKKQINVFDYSSDELDIRLFDEKGIAILRRKLIKGESYLYPYTSHPEKAQIVAQGITAFLFSASYGGKYQLEPLSWSTTQQKSFDISEYFTQYFAVCKKLYIDKQKSEASSVHKNMDDEFIKFHIKDERQKYKKSKVYLSEKNTNRLSDLDKSSYVNSYLKWINKKDKRKKTDYLLLTILAIIQILLILFCLLQFILKDWEYNYVQKVVSYLDNIESETVQDFGRFLNVGIVSVIYWCYKKFNKILKIK